jgi:hypothetical protein
MLWARGNQKEMAGLEIAWRARGTGVAQAWHRRGGARPCTRLANHHQVEAQRYTTIPEPHRAQKDNLIYGCIDLSSTSSIS